MVKLATDRATGQQWACKIMSLPPPGKQYNENESRWAERALTVGSGMRRGPGRRSALL